MIIVMKPEASEKEIEAVIDVLVSRDFDVHRSTGDLRTVLGVVGSGIKEVEELVRRMPGVEQVIRITKD
ncbi:MAG: hypothetical protein Kow00109_08900 [Acidobacteriota bacterium]